MSATMSYSIIFGLIITSITLLNPLNAEVVFVYGIQRHAARNVLPKSANLSESDALGGPTILPQGEQQAYNTGVSFQQRYLNETTCGSTCLFGRSIDGTVAPLYGLINTTQGIFNAYNTVIRSSGLDRTISTARSFLAGSFPPITINTNNYSSSVDPGNGLPDGQQVIPVYSLGEDPLIRAYTQCPTYVNRLNTWYSSDEFLQKSQETNATRTAIAALSPSINGSLANWYNVWDAFNVNKNYGVGNTMPNIDNATFIEMQDIAYWLETAKMNSNLTTNLLGGLLLGDVVAKLQSARANITDGNVTVYDRLLWISSHYNTQLGVLGALQLDQSAHAGDISWLSKIPEFAAIAVIEMHASPSISVSSSSTLQQQDRVFAVRMLMQDGPNAEYQTIPLPCAVSGDEAENLAGAGSCSLDNFITYVEPLSFSSMSDWCTACNNTAYPACQVVALQNKITSMNGVVSSSGNASAWQIALAVVLTAIGVAGLTSIGFVLYYRNKYKNVEMQDGLLPSKGVSSSSSLQV